jgi:signal transduction histidine kinase
MGYNVKELEEKLKTAVSFKQKVDTLNDLSELLRSENLEKSDDYANQSVSIAETENYSEGLAKAYWLKGVICRLRSNYESAFNHFEKSLALYTKLNDLNGKAKILNSIGNIYSDIGDFDKSIESLNQSLSLFRQINDEEFEAIVLANIGLLYQQIGNFDESLNYYLQSIQKYFSRELIIPENLLNNIGVVFKNTGDFQTALEYFNKSLSITESKNNHLESAFTLLNIAEIYNKLSEQQNSEDYLLRAVNLLNNKGIKIDYNSLGRFNKHFQSGDSVKDSSLNFLFKLLDLRHAISDSYGKLYTLITIGEIFLSMKDFSQANIYFNECLLLSRKIKDIPGEIINLKYLGLIKFRTDKTDEALILLEHALKIAESKIVVKELLDINFILYEVYKNRGELGKALNSLEKTYNICREFGSKETEKRLSNILSKAQVDIKEKEMKIALQEKEIFHLKNVELANMNDNLIKINQDKNDFINIVSHDLKNPLSGILSFSKKIGTEFENYSPDKIKSFASEIEKASNKMFELISKLLDLNKLESGKRIFTSEQFDPAVLTERVVFDNRPRATIKNIEIIFENKINIDGNNKIQINSDKTGLRQILDNLVSNAIKFSPSGKQVFVRLKNENDKIIFEVEDNGPGLPDKDKEKLFVQFAKLSAVPTAGENSTGLGLSIVKKLTEYLNGTISCESEKGNGAKFILTLPL